MIDPRDETVNSDDQLTGDELEDELVDLDKEYQIRKQKLLEKKKQQQERSARFLQGVEHRPIKEVDLAKRIVEFQDLGEKKYLECEDVEPFSKETIRSRYFDHKVIDSFVKEHEVKVMNVNKILSKIVGPSYKEPDYNNWAFIGIIVEKSQNLKTSKKEGYVKLRVGNFHHSITINLFGESYKKYWKLMAGDLVMILNPTIYKPPTGGTFAFSMGDGSDNILVIGMVKDIIKCQDPQCNKYVRSKHRFCDFHSIKEDGKVLKNKRMELNGSVKMFNPMERTINEESKIFHMKSQFDSAKYIDDKVFQKKGLKRKMQDEATNRVLEDKLMKLANNAKFEKIGLLKLKSQEIDSLQKNRAKRHDSLKEELKSLTKDKKIRLGMSKQDKLSKLKRWNDNLTKANIAPIIPPQSSTALTSVQNVNFDNSADESDELKIAFTTPDQLDSYNKLKPAPKKKYT